MPIDLTWGDIALRLTLTVVAGALIGMNREEHGHPAGLRTTLLVCLAASVAMIQTNILINTVGKKPDSFIVMDLMRLPLGILSGMGFIGAGAILRRDNVVIGVTIAATLWFVTVLGLCFGGGQISLGLATLALGLLVLGGLKTIEKHFVQHQRAIVTVTISAGGPDEGQILRSLADAGCKVTSTSISYMNATQTCEYDFTIQRRTYSAHPFPPDALKFLAAAPGVSHLVWKPS